MKIHLLLTLLTGAALAVAPAAEPYQPDPGNRKENRPAELWETYMHGVVDTFATPLTPRFRNAARIPVKIETPYLNCETEAFEVPKGKSYLSATVLNVEKYRGKTLRFFYWMRGFDTGAKPVVNSYHDAPQLYVLIKDSKDRTLSKIISHNGAVGTYPWHCYYRDVHIPSNASRARLQIENLNGGRAEFARFSYEPVGPENTYSGSERQDPATGSVAAFPRYEPINFHFFAKPFGLKYVWNFMRGPAAGMVGQPYDLTTIDGLRRYFRESVKTDLDQMNHGIMYFPMRYHQAKAANVLPPMEEGWLEELGRLIIADQDPETGYWGTQAIPKSMSVTFHYTDMLFSLGVERYDAKAVPDPRRCLAETMPHAEQIVRTTLKLQSKKNGELAAWSGAAYNFTENPDASGSGCQLGSTMNAIRMLRICRRFVSPELQQEIDRSIEAAFRYALTTVILPDGVYKQQDVDKVATKSSYWPNIIEYSRYLESRCDATLPAPELVRNEDGTLSCRNWPERQNSIRLYALAENESPANNRLCGIISRGDANIIELDPIVATRRMAAAARNNWGKSAFPSRGYLYDKVFRLPPKQLPTTIGEEAISVTVPAGKKLFATSVDWYGAESEPVPVP